MGDRSQSFLEQFDSPVCVLSVERNEKDRRRTIRIVTGNRHYLDTIENPMPGLNTAPKKFVPNLEYTNYVPQDMNFEQACVQAAIHQKRVSGYAHPDNFDFWFSMLFLPLHSDDPELGYCAYMMELSKEPDAANMSATSSSIATAVLETCIKLRSADDLRDSMELICKDIRDLCDSEHCCFFLVDTHKRKCSVLCEALSEDTKLLPMTTYVNDAFYDIAASWEATIAGSNCLIIRNEHDMEIVRERNPVWVESITGAGGDEFVVILTGLPEEQLPKYTEQLHGASGKYPGLVFAIGTAYESRAADVRAALHNADERMYADKKRYYELHPEAKRSSNSGE